jgi:hypothetical protein
MSTNFSNTEKTKSDDSNKIRKYRGDITTDTMEIKMNIRDYWEQLYTNKLDSSEKKWVNSTTYQDEIMKK